MKLITIQYHHQRSFIISINYRRHCHRWTIAAMHLRGMLKRLCPHQMRINRINLVCQHSPLILHWRKHCTIAIYQLTNKNIHRHSIHLYPNQFRCVHLVRPIHLVYRMAMHTTIVIDVHWNYRHHRHQHHRNQRHQPTYYQYLHPYLVPIHPVHSHRCYPIHHLKRPCDARYHHQPYFHQRHRHLHGIHFGRSHAMCVGRVGALRRNGDYVATCRSSVYVYSRTLKKKYEKLLEMEHIHHNYLC